jgi:acyl dehydratase
MVRLSLDDTTLGTLVANLGYDKLVYPKPVFLGKPALSRALRAQGYRKLSARPKHHAQDREAIEAFQKGLFRRAGEAPSDPPAL